MATGNLKFAPGDVVVLNSGGPQMTVKNTSDEDGVYCEWFDAKRTKLEGSWFLAASLKTPPPPSMPAVAQYRRDERDSVL